MLADAVGTDDGPSSDAERRNPYDPGTRTNDARRDDVAASPQAGRLHDGHLGKWHLGDEEPYQPHKRGFDEAFIHGAGGIGQAYACSCGDAPGNKYFDPVIRHNGSFVKTHGYCTDLFFTAALGWIKQARAGDAPFFAYITTNAPHGPFIAPPKNTKRFTDLGFTEKTAGFYGMIENIDENMGRLMKKLEQWEPPICKFSFFCTVQNAKNSRELQITPKMRA